MRIIKSKQVVRLFVEIGRNPFLDNKDKFLEICNSADLPQCLQSTKSPREFAEQLVTEAHQYNGFNLIVADICSKTMVYISNRPKGEPITIRDVSPGIHVLSNAKLDSPWHKVKDH